MTVTVAVTVRRSGGRRVAALSYRRTRPGRRRAEPFKLLEETLGRCVTAAASEAAAPGAGRAMRGGPAPARRLTRSLSVSARAESWPGPHGQSQ